MNYGIPYLGSKSKIVKHFAHLFPKATNFYDLFGGGFSVTHYMLKHRANDFQNFHFNEIRKGVCKLIQDSIAGKYSYENFKPEWVSRDEFFKEKENNPYIKLCWSFGNNGRTYLFGKNIEQYKKSMHQAVVFGDFDNLAKEVLQFSSWPKEFSITDRRRYLRRTIEHYRKTNIPKTLHQYLSNTQLQRLQQIERLERLQQIERLERLQQLEQLEQLQRLERLPKIKYYELDYRDIKIEKDSVIYCDIPYKNTGKYDGNIHFNHDEFYQWAQKQTEPLFVSEYNLEIDGFYEVYSREKKATISAKGPTRSLEKIYCNEAAREMLNLLFV